MLKKISYFESDFSVSKAAGIVGFFTLLIKLVALYRERLLSGTFGQGAVLDTYFSAFRVPDFLTNLFVLSTLSVAFLPIFTALGTANERQAHRFANKVITVFGACIAALCFVLFAFSPQLVRMVVPKFQGRQLVDAIALTRLFLLSPIIFTIGTIYGGILNAKKQFVVSSFAPLLYNLGIIGGVLFLYPRFGILGLGYGVILGALAQLAVQIMAAAGEGYIFQFHFNRYADELKDLWKLYLPRIFSFDLSNITLLFGSIIGSAASGAISSLNQAYNLQSVPVGIFGYSLAVAVFPVLSEFYATKDEEGYIASLGKSISQTLFFIIPVSILVLIYRAYIVRLILGTGKFDWNDTIRTFEVLGVFSFSFFSQSLTTLLSRAFFARHNTKIPVIANITALVINIALAAWLGRDYGIMGLAIAFVVSSMANACMLLTLLRQTLGMEFRHRDKAVLHTFDHELLVTIWKVSLASMAMGLICYAGLKVIAPHVNTHTVLGIFIQCALSGAAGSAVFVMAAQILKISETQKSWEYLKRMLRIVGF